MQQWIIWEDQGLDVADDKIFEWLFGNDLAVVAEERLGQGPDVHRWQGLMRHECPKRRQQILAAFNFAQLVYICGIIT